VAVLGLFDAADYGELLRARILERELGRRLPLARVDRYAPLGEERPIALDGGRPALTLGAPERSRTAELAGRHDLVVVTGDVVHTRDDVYADLYGIPVGEAERLRPSGFFVDGLGGGCHVAWHHVGVPYELDAAEMQRVRSGLGSVAHVSVRGEASRERLLAAGSRSDIRAVPDPAVLADRLFPAEVLRKRLEYLRAMEWYPAEPRPVVVEGELPTHLVLEDLVAAIAHARAFVAASAAGRAVALSFGIPPVDATVDESLRDELQRRVDAEYDALAALAERAWSARAASGSPAPADLLRALGHAEERYEALLRAYDRRGARLVEDRLRYAEIVEALEAAADGLAAEAVERAAELQNQLEVARAEEAEARFELQRLQAERGAPTARG
jgi:hypothetical protein